jgi:hypothetical protein
METKSSASSSKTFLVKVFKSKSFEKMLVLKSVINDSFLPRTFAHFLPGVKSGDVVTFEGRIYKNAKGFDAIYIIPKTIKVV